MQDVKGHVVEFCKDKAGSHFIQGLLEDGSPEQVAFSTLRNLVDLNNMGGFYQHSSQAKQISVDKHSTSVFLEDLSISCSNSISGSTLEKLQCLVAKAACCLQFLLGLPLQVTGVINEVREHILVLMKDAFGNYVVQKMLEKASPAEKRWMLHCICADRPLPNRVVALSKDHHSCRVIQTALQVRLQAHHSHIQEAEWARHQETRLMLPNNCSQACKDAGGVTLICTVRSNQRPKQRHLALTFLLSAVKKPLYKRSGVLLSSSQP